jgi:hypothetical protein
MPATSCGLRIATLVSPFRCAAPSDSRVTICHAIEHYRRVTSGGSRMQWRSRIDTACNPHDALARKFLRLRFHRKALDFLAGGIRALRIANSTKCHCAKLFNECADFRRGIALAVQPSINCSGGDDNERNYHCQWVEGWAESGCRAGGVDGCCSRGSECVAQRAAGYDVRIPDLGLRGSVAGWPCLGAASILARPWIRSLIDIARRSFTSRAARPR